MNIYVKTFNNNISYLPELPLYLRRLLCFNCNLKELPNLSEFINIKYLDCSRNNLKELNNLPINLCKLDCSFNELINLDNLPKKLITLI